MHNNLAEGWNGWDRFYGIFLLVSAKTRYDANGNLVYVYTSRTKKDGMADEKIAERKLKWNEENRLLAADENGFVSNYWYDADGERTVKTSGEGGADLCKLRVCRRSHEHCQVLIVCISLPRCQPRRTLYQAYLYR